MTVLGAPSIILYLPDRKEHLVPPEDLAWIADQAASFVNADHVQQVMTHGPDGEYGHPLHRAASAVVTNTCEDPQRLWYFNFDEAFDLEIADPSAWRRKMRAVDCYLGSDASGWDPADRCHVELGRRESPVRASDYERPWELVSRTYERSGMVIT
jgi:LmbE family N-acetylglucosaminyl deacetylase